MKNKKDQGLAASVPAGSEPALRGKTRARGKAPIQDQLLTLPHMQAALIEWAECACGSFELMKWVSEKCFTQAVRLKFVDDGNGVLKDLQRVLNGKKDYEWLFLQIVNRMMTMAAVFYSNGAMAGACGILDKPDPTPDMRTSQPDPASQPNSNPKVSDCEKLRYKP